MDTQILDFWIGNFSTEEDFEEFVNEDEEFYVEEESDETHNSKFAESQDTIWLDYDFVEYGFDDTNNNIYDKFSEYSFADQWLPTLVSRINELKIKADINSLIFLNSGQIAKPVSVEDEMFSLVYLGKIEFAV
ncbi:immunity 22 family protein [Chryseobacterium polytrichastri]|uniref:Immunity protein 22 n=1 Tax=Chryseobacterium polytrichastri TaxID=1302687 RepID=A0A1M6SKX0_9FLAO|nr:immunity 22 family protein [Chryseobacterium polytrichastri]SHK45286.1 Immunity protein 22 [Chryseobacterium polytrichastri]